MLEGKVVDNKELSYKSFQNLIQQTLNNHLSHLQSLENEDLTPFHQSSSINIPTLIDFGLAFYRNIIKNIIEQSSIEPEPLHSFENIEDKQLQLCWFMVNYFEHKLGSENLSTIEQLSIIQNILSWYNLISKTSTQYKQETFDNYKNHEQNLIEILSFENPISYRQDEATSAYNSPVIKRLSPTEQVEKDFFAVQQLDQDIIEENQKKSHKQEELRKTYNKKLKGLHSDFGNLREQQDELGRLYQTYLKNWQALTSNFELKENIFQVFKDNKKVLRRQKTYLDFLLIDIINLSLEIQNFDLSELENFSSEKISERKNELEKFQEKLKAYDNHIDNFHRAIQALEDQLQPARVYLFECQKFFNECYPKDQDSVVIESQMHSHSKVYGSTENINKQSCDIPHKSFRETESVISETKYNNSVQREKATASDISKKRKPDAEKPSKINTKKQKNSAFAEKKSNSMKTLNLFEELKTTDKIPPVRKARSNLNNPTPLNIVEIKLNDENEISRIESAGNPILLLLHDDYLAREKQSLNLSVFSLSKALTHLGKYFIEIKSATASQDEVQIAYLKLKLQALEQACKYIYTAGESDYKSPHHFKFFSPITKRLINNYNLSHSQQKHMQILKERATAEALHLVVNYNMHPNEVIELAPTLFKFNRTYLSLATKHEKNYILSKQTNTETLIRESYLSVSA